MMLYNTKKYMLLPREHIFFFFFINDCSRGSNDGSEPRQLSCDGATQQQADQCL